MSPVVKAPAAEKETPRGRRWLLVLAMTPFVGLLLLLIPLVHPIELQLGDTLVTAGIAPVPAYMADLIPQGVSGEDGTISLHFAIQGGNRAYTVEGRSAGSSCESPAAWGTSSGFRVASCDRGGEIGTASSSVGTTAPHLPLQSSDESGELLRKVYSRGVPSGARYIKSVRTTYLTPAVTSLPSWTIGCWNSKAIPVLGRMETSGSTKNVVSPPSKSSFR